MLTYEALKSSEPHTIFASGVFIDNELGININNTGYELRWVAIRGYAVDWCIYYMGSKFDVDFVSRYGDKLCGKTNIRKFVECDDEAFEAYRL